MSKMKKVIDAIKLVGKLVLATFIGACVLVLGNLFLILFAAYFTIFIGVFLSLLMGLIIAGPFLFDLDLEEVEK